MGNDSKSAKSFKKSMVEKKRINDWRVEMKMKTKKKNMKKILKRILRIFYNQAKTKTCLDCVKPILQNTIANQPAIK